MFNDKAGMALRGTFLVDADGTIAFAEVNGPATRASSPAGRTPSRSRSPAERARGA